MGQEKIRVSLVFRKRHIFILSFCLFFCLLTSLINADLLQTAVIPVQFRSATELLPIVKNLLSENGRISVDVQTNSLILTDNGESIDKVRKFLEGYDKPVKQARISIRFKEMGSHGEGSISVEGRVSGKGWTVSKGRKRRNGLEVHMRDQRRNRRQESEYFINVSSGSWAYILVGEEIPYVERWRYLCQRYADHVGRWVFQRIETGMEVRPIIVSDHAYIEIMPRISHEVSKGQKEIIRFTKASTELTVPLGKWVDIGGSDEKSKEVISAILDSGKGKQSVSLSMALRVESF